MNNTITINGITVPRVNMCTVLTRKPDAEDMVRCWDRDRIVRHLDDLPAFDREVLRKQLNRVKGKVC